MTKLEKQHANLERLFADMVGVMSDALHENKLILQGLDEEATANEEVTKVEEIPELLELGQTFEMFGTTLTIVSFSTHDRDAPVNCEGVIDINTNGFAGRQLREFFVSRASVEVAVMSKEVHHEIIE